jgi:hypothetical protein
MWGNRIRRCHRVRYPVNMVDEAQLFDFLNSPFGCLRSGIVNVYVGCRSLQFRKTPCKLFSVRGKTVSVKNCEWYFWPWGGIQLKRDRNVKNKSIVSFEETICFEFAGASSLFLAYISRRWSSH